MGLIRHITVFLISEQEKATSFPAVLVPQIKTTGSKRAFALIQSIQARFWLGWGSSFNESPHPTRKKRA
jgi:hypothetical protein